MNRPQEHAARQVDESAPAKKTPAAWFEAGLRLLQAGQLTEAEQCGRSALALDQSHADSLHLMGMLCVAAKQYDLAIEWLTMAVRQNPDVADYLSNLGLALQRRDRFDEAITCYDRALLLEPGQAEIWFRMGESLQHERRLDEAIQCFDQALKLDPRHAVAARGSATLHFDEGRYEQAIASFDRLLELRPDLAGAHNLRGICLLQLGRLEEALANCSKAIELAPDDAHFASNIGLVLHGLGRDEEALDHSEKALALNPAFPLALNNRAQSLLALLRFDEALAVLDQAIAIDPDFDKAHWNVALTRLLLGDFEGGWARRERGRGCRDFFVDRKFTRPHWLGDVPIAGQTILLHSDEGLGDTIQYARYVKLVAQLGARVILEVPAPVHALLSGIEGVSLCLKRGAALPDFDFHCPLSALPLAFKTRLETIPSDVPYLPAPPNGLRQAWEARLGPHDKMRIGLVWSGSPAHGNDRKRSMRLATMCRILDVDARFFSLQKDARSDDRATLTERPDIVDLTTDFTDFVETASMLSCLDLVISVDTSVAHLAGALAREAWILLPYAPDYRWLLDRSDSPWYPTVRLFRQSAARDYAEVLDRVRTQLNARIAAWQSSTLRKETPAAGSRRAFGCCRPGRSPRRRNAAAARLPSIRPTPTRCI
jgi:tetratricopeptide (TPR) repeat protein